MSKKRMILEEVEEKNQLVPGSPENPVKLGERQKTLLVRLKLIEDDPKFGVNEWGQSRFSVHNLCVGDSEALERLLFLKLVEESLVLQGGARLESEQRMLELQRQASAKMLVGDETCRKEWDEVLVLKAKLSAKCWRLTDAGRALLLAGTVTISL